MDRDVGVRMFCFGLQAVLVRDNMWMGGKNRLLKELTWRIALFVERS